MSNDVLNCVDVITGKVSCGAVRTTMEGVTVVAYFIRILDYKN